MKSIKHTLSMVKRLTELEAAMRQPAGVLLSEYQELQSLREQLADRYHKSVGATEPTDLDAQTPRTRGAVKR